MVNCGKVEVSKSSSELKLFIQNNTTDVLEVEDALQWINNSLLETASENQKIVFFIHGFWASLPFAFNRTSYVFDKYYFTHKPSNIAAIVHVIWDSNAIPYNISRINIDKSKHVLADVFNRLSQNISFRYSLMCHSMGNRFLYETLKSEDVKVKFEELLLIAPDLGFKLFQESPHLFSDSAKRVIVFYHSKDKTLKMSGYLNRAVRLGRLSISTENSNIEFLDFSYIKDIHSVSDRVMRHLYFITSKTVEAKIEEILDN